MEKLKCNKDNMPTAFSMSELRDSRVAGIEEDGDDDLDWTLIHFVWKRWEEMTWGLGEKTGNHCRAGAAGTCSHGHMTECADYWT